jgi:hypothetical protein
MTKQFIIKIQTPLATNEPEPKALMYNERRTFQQMVPINSRIVQLMAGQPKRYFNATLQRGTLQIGEPVTEQVW